MTLTGRPGEAVRAMATLAMASFAVALSGLSCAQGSFGPYVPTPMVIVERLLAFAEISKEDYLIDLGSGDGRIVITAAKRFGARGHGIDIQEKLVSLASQNALAAGVSDRVRFEQGDLFQADLSRASVVTLYLLPNTITRLVPKLLLELQPGSRVVSHDYPLQPWPSERHLSFDLEEKRAISGTTLTMLYYYVVPARLQGVWELRLPAAAAAAAGAAAAGTLRLTISQTAEGATARAGIGNESVLLRDFSVKGEQVSFTLPRPGQPALALSGKAVADSMTGALAGEPWSARRIQAEVR